LQNSIRLCRRQLGTASPFCDAKPDFCNAMVANEYVTGFCNASPTAAEQLKAVVSAAACPSVNNYLKTAIKLLKGGKVTAVIVGNKRVLSQQELQRMGKVLSAEEKVRQPLKKANSLFDDPVALIPGCYSPTIKLAACGIQTQCILKQSNPQG